VHNNIYSKKVQKSFVYTAITFVVLVRKLLPIGNASLTLKFWF